MMDLDHSPTAVSLRWDISNVLCDCNWPESDPLHVGADLIRYLLEHLLCQITALHCLPKLNELHNVPETWPTLIVSEHAAVAVKFFHSAEVSIADSDNDDGGRQGRQLDHLRRRESRAARYECARSHHQHCGLGACPRGLALLYRLGQSSPDLFPTRISLRTEHGDEERDLFGDLIARVALLGKRFTYKVAVRIRTVP